VLGAVGDEAPRSQAMVVLSPGELTEHRLIECHPWASSRNSKALLCHEKNMPQRHDSESDGPIILK